MNHVELDQELSNVIKDLRAGTIKKDIAREIVNACGKKVANCRNEITFIQMGIPVDVPLMGLKQIDFENKAIATPPTKYTPAADMEETIKEIEEKKKAPYKFKD